ncbi:MAG: 50S ribosomal protein L27 [Candidatus Peregrinibacteria bacterium]
MAHKKAGGSTSNGRDSNAKRLGVKKFGGQVVIPGNIILRQRGNKYFAGENVQTGVDFTLFSTASGRVQFYEKKQTKFNGRVYKDTFVKVVSE